MTVDLSQRTGAQVSSPEGICTGDAALLTELHPFTGGPVAVAAREGSKVGDEARGKEHVSCQVDVVLTQLLSHLSAKYADKDEGGQIIWNCKI